MKRSRFTEEQIIGVLKEHELGAKTADLCRKHGISEQTFYNWKSKFGGLDVSEAKRLKQLQDENGSVSGVSLDEEASNLIQYQTAYQSAAKVVSAINLLLLDAVNLGMDAAEE